MSVLVGHDLRQCPRPRAIGANEIEITLSATILDIHFNSKPFHISQPPRTTMSKHPQIKWAETDDVVFISLQVPNCTDEKISVEGNVLNFS